MPGVRRVQSLLHLHDSETLSRDISSRRVSPAGVAGGARADEEAVRSRSDRQRQLSASCQGTGTAFDREEANETRVAERHRPPRDPHRVDRLLGRVAELDQGTRDPGARTGSRRPGSSPRRASPPGPRRRSVPPPSASARDRGCAGRPRAGGSGSAIPRRPTGSRPPTSIRTSNIESISVASAARSPGRAPGSPRRTARLGSRSRQRCRVPRRHGPLTFAARQRSSDPRHPSVDRRVLPSGRRAPVERARRTGGRSNG